MKAKLEFNLPDEKNEYLLAVHSQELFSFIWQFRQTLRNISKFDELSDDQVKIVEHINDIFCNNLNDLSINLDSIE